ncbi:MAG: TRAM domain-containing protein [Synergistaceae bacterium]|nr:TRAM domain-containing protein [Synergistaceae bacterium]
MLNETFLKRGLSIFLFFIGAIAGFHISQILFSLVPNELVQVANSTFLVPYKKFALTVISISCFAAFGLFVVPLMMKMIDLLVSAFDALSHDVSWNEIVASIAGLVVGLVIANLMTAPFWTMPMGGYAALIINVIFGLAFLRLFLRHQRGNPRGSILGGEKNQGLSFAESSRKIVDSSVAIDARILDIAKTGFISGVLIIPNLVLLELQAIADSTEPTKRAKGRRGLDTIKGLQKLTDYLSVEIASESFQELQVDSVDSALLELAKKMNAVVLTTDYNLSKLAQIQDVHVFNINDLGNAMKPQFLPGDLIEIDVLREGKEPNQGIGYLDDGTMLVVEEGESWIGKRLEVIVTSMLQTSAGRLVFGKFRREVRPLEQTEIEGRVR